jgi:hypothetical protein
MLGISVVEVQRALTADRIFAFTPPTGPVLHLGQIHKQTLGSRLPSQFISLSSNDFDIDHCALLPAPL